MRKCENWLQTFRDWVVPRSEAPESFVFWAGASTIASALRRQVFIPRSELGGWECFPHLYVMFVGPPGMRKSTAMDFGIDIQVNDPNIKRPPTLITKESLVNTLIQSPDSSASVNVKEFSDLIMKGGKEMYDLLTSLYDANRDLSVGTLARGFEGTERPCLNFAACTTPGWISANMPEESISGGFASRVIFVYEQDLSKRRLFWRKEMANGGETRFNEMAERLTHDLVHISSNLAGTFSFTDEAVDKMEDWYQKMSATPLAKKAAGYAARKHVHVLKLAMILAVSQSDELVINWPTAEAAINILTQTEKRLPLVFAGVGKNKYSIELGDMADYIKVNNPVPRAKLLEHFKSSAEPDKLNGFITGLVMMKYIKEEVDSNEKDIMLHWIKKEE